MSSCKKGIAYINKNLQNICQKLAVDAVEDFLMLTFTSGLNNFR